MVDPVALMRFASDLNQQGKRQDLPRYPAPTLLMRILSPEFPQVPGGAVSPSIRRGAAHA